MKVVNVSIAEWMERCPDPSVAGSTGTGSTYAVVLCEMPTTHVTTKRDMKQVPKKNILIGDDTGKVAELVIWGAFACRAWMYSVFGAASLVHLVTLRPGILKEPCCF